MASRTWLAVALCCFVWFGYMKYFAPIPPQQQVANQAANSVASPVASNGPPISVSVLPQALDSVETEVVSNGKQELGFSAVGGRLSRVSLLDFKDSIKKEARPIVVQGPGISKYNLATLFSDAALEGFTNATYKVEKAPQAIRFSHAQGGLELQKEFVYGSSDYIVDSTYKLKFPAKSDRKDWGFLYVPVGAMAPKYDQAIPLQAWEVVLLQNDSVVRKHVDALKEPSDVHQGTTSWLAFGNRYFATALVNGSEINPDVVLTHSDGFTGGYLRFPIVRKQGQEAIEFKLKIFAGPKEYSDLSKINGLKQLIDYGMFSFLAYPMLELLRFFYRMIHNWGIAIILLTVLVRLLFYPLSMKSFKSMRAMQKLQPQIAAMREKYKDDMQRFNQEQMALFKAHKVNPMGGCFPMLVQLPVFIALYAVLGNSLELFHAPFFGWIQDLSSKDPFYVYPVLMGISMLFQTKLTPSVGADPIQQKMMYLMPLVFTFIMLNLPSGLTLYIFVSTVLGIVQQVSMRDPGARTAAVIVSKPEGAPEKG